ncbi:MAG: glycosyltransferase, partial [Anaerolineae bacterium]|nr:glycosyltransferase [Anaerolineae bacterium]
FRRCSIAVAPSTWHDPCPTVAMEAMASAAPVIASAVGGLVDIVADGVTGLLVPPSDAAALRAALKTLLDDPARRVQMGQQGLERVTLFQSHSVVTRLEAAYQSVLQAV